MTTAQMLQIFVQLATALLALGAFVRAGRWNESDKAKKMDERMNKTEGDVRVLASKVEGMPSKADVAVLTQTSNSNHELLLITRAQLNRIENFLFEVKS